MTKNRHFIDLHRIDAKELRAMLDAAKTLKKTRGDATQAKTLGGKSLAMIFEKNSTRTRVSFEVAMAELGGHALHLASTDMQLGRGETVADTARALSRYVHAIMLRCHRHDDLLTMAEYASVPVINALSDQSHPCQIMADMLTIEERVGTVKGKTIAWVGDGNNVAQTFMQAAAKFGFSLRLACPDALLPKQKETYGADVAFTDDPLKALQGADVVVTDAWVSMGDKDAEARRKLLAPYQVNAALMQAASPQAIFLHCLPAHRGEEVTAEVIDGPQSAIWDEAENRLHVQKAVLLWCLNAL